jgi:hypothetical protein
MPCPNRDCIPHYFPVLGHVFARVHRECKPLTGGGSILKGQWRCHGRTSQTQLEKVRQRSNQPTSCRGHPMWMNKQFPKELDVQEVPGPGAYEVLNTSCTGPAYTMAKRTLVKSRNSSSMPGPGEYDLNAASEQRGPAFTLAPRRGQPAPRLEVPGPGAYEGEAKG